ncbi:MULTISPECIES: hypothetical protein [Pontibacillus]|uniref:Uncharacterized protein n=1 Tax=Pontibacillus chungwhensis TaxID=265426 RepID=A0ABY8V5I5_9BACI|nr:MULTISPECIES: hypothetical protein [Pontibacillus]MCD5322564.1 hypothetical protein [Pontibacillus sp. HN14]WIF99849.1 hypothetical protein QNI29_09370 [Pontibacillus chungwhensis]
MTEVEKAWELFLDTLNAESCVHLSYKKIIAGLPFVYVFSTSEKMNRPKVEESLKRAAATAMKGKRLTLSMTYVREYEALYVYRVRFLVPQQKMFCCGNMCTDCIRFQ